MHSGGLVKFILLIYFNFFGFNFAASATNVYTTLHTTLVMCPPDPNCCRAVLVQSPRYN